MSKAAPRRDPVPATCPCANGHPLARSAQTTTREALSSLPARDAVAVEAGLKSDPDLAAALGRVLSGECGIPARDLLLRCLAERLARGVSLRGALIPALAQALRIARTEAVRRWSSERRLR